MYLTTVILLLEVFLYISTPGTHFYTHLSLAFLLAVHPQWWREFWGNGWRFLTCRGWTKKCVITMKLQCHSTNTTIQICCMNACFQCRRSHNRLCPPSDSWTHMAQKLSSNSIVSLQNYFTCPACTPLLCTPGGWPVSRHHLRVCRANWAKSQDTGVYIYKHLKKTTTVGWSDCK